MPFSHTQLRLCKRLDSFFYGYQAAKSRPPTHTETETTTIQNTARSRTNCLNFDQFHHAGQHQHMEEAMALLHRYRDEQRGGAFPVGTTIIIIQPDPMHRDADNSPFEHQHNPAPMAPMYPKRFVNSVEDVALMAIHYAAQQPDGKFPSRTVVPEFRPYNVRAARNAKRDVEDQRGPRAPPQAPAPPLCGNCGKCGHTVEKCVGPPAEDGFIYACPLHNTRDHTLADCYEAQGWSLEKRYEHLVLMRPHLPPFHFVDDWEDIAWLYIRCMTQVRKRMVEHDLPLSAEFSKNIPLEAFDAYNYDTPDPACLGHEPETATVPAFMQWYWEVVCGSGYDDDDMDTRSEGSDENGENSLEQSRHALDPNFNAMV